MLEALLHGALLWLILSGLIGPVFFMLIETSLAHGYRKAFVFDLGVFFSDLFCLLIAYYGTSELLSDVHTQGWIFYAGGIIFISFGIVRFFTKPLKAMRNTFKKKNYYRVFIKGFLLNMVNPSVLLFWIATCTLAISLYGYGSINIFLFFTGIMFTVLFFDQVKILSARYFKKRITPTFIFRMNQLVGVVFFVFGILLILKNLFR